MKRRPKGRPEQITGILEGFLKQKGLIKKVRQYSIFDIWKDIVGEMIAEKATPAKMAGDSLVVFTKNAAWANELSFMKDQILKKIKEALPDSEIKDIRFIAGRL